MVCLESIVIDHSLVCHDFVSFDFNKGQQLFGMSVSRNFMRVEDRNRAWLILRKANFLKNVLFRKIKVQLLFATDIETKSTDLAFDFALTSSVAEILGPSGSTFDDGILLGQFVFELA